MIHSRIVGTGSHLPEKILTNFDLEKMVDTTDEWIRSRTGIERRHIAADGETTWFEGLLLIGVYVLLGLAFFFVDPA